MERSQVSLQGGEKLQRIVQSVMVASEKIHSKVVGRDDGARIQPRMLDGTSGLASLRQAVTGVSNAVAAAAAKMPLICDPAATSASSSRSSPSRIQKPGTCDVDQEGFLLFQIPEVPYLVVAGFLDAKALCQLDAACRYSRAMDLSALGPWRSLGVTLFQGVELDAVGAFDAVAENKTGKSVVHESCWKKRYLQFLQELPTFREPFTGNEIQAVGDADEVAYCRCMLRAAGVADVGVFIHIDVIANPDNLSLAVVDFEAGGHSSVTFSPDTGAVIRERKIRHVPRKVEGAYIQPLPATTPGRRFEGAVGIYLEAGNLAFLRKTARGAEQPPACWESTGFVTDLSWAQGRCLTPCVAFRDEGQYHVKILRVDSCPPVHLGKPPQVYDEDRWTSLDWEATDSELEEEN
eukprot:TRINITY_DN11198_c0_g1_i1.p1 TRINITY_DN11198_c0_g1~~TRINITY_DN11198_c0_g1_i1.p1  ORF type:complete len:406 (-),score=69.65 TRINITY_DN11198_c0_g1_i1:242-1459(-)